MRKSKLKLATTKPDLKELTGYLTNCNYIVERVDDRVYAEARKVCAAWEPVADLPDEYCGNIYIGMRYNRARETFEYVKDECDAWKDPKYVSFCRSIPSALMLYRILCHFKATVHTEGPAGYKLVWQIALKHKATGEVLIFREWKGGISLGHQGRGRVTNGTFERDMISLLNLLVSETCPHPYDGVVAGSVA